MDQFDSNALLRNMPSSIQEAQQLLQMLGQSQMPAPSVVTPLNPMEEAMVKGVDPVGHMPSSLLATKELLRSLGLSGIEDATSSMSTALTDVVAQSQGGVPEPKGIVANLVTSAPTPTSEDPLAADRNGWNLPKTGKVNTTGAEQRINARAAAEGTGVTATKDASGRMVLSNMGGMNPNPVGVAPTLPNTLAGSVELLRKATNPDEASGIISNIRRTAALESAKLNTDAMTFAGNKLGVPALEAYLKASEQNDRASPSWFPGIGDSPGTARIRQDLNQARAAADIEAKRYMDTNTNAAMLKGTVATAEAEMRRIERLGERRATLTDNLDIRAQAKEDEDNRKAAETLGAMTPDMISRLVVLNPSLAQSPDRDNLVAKMYKDASNNPPVRDALRATAQQLPLLALDGNPAAITILISKEKASNPGLSDELIQSRLDAIRNKANSPGFDEVMIKQSGLTGDEAKTALGNLRMAKAGGTPEEKRQKHQERLAAALEMERRNTTVKFASDTGAWGISDPLFVAAQTTSASITGRKDLDGVVTAYLDGAVGAPALVKLDAFNKILEASVAKQGASLFGMPDIKALKAQAIKRVRQDPDWLRAMTSIHLGQAAPGLQFQGPQIN